MRILKKYNFPIMRSLWSLYGSIYGLLLAKYYDSVNIWIHKSWKIKILVLFVHSGIWGTAYLNFKSIEFYGDYLLRTFLGIVLLAIVIVITLGFKVWNHVKATKDLE